MTPNRPLTLTRTHVCVCVCMCVHARRRVGCSVLECVLQCVLQRVLQCVAVCHVALTTTLQDHTHTPRMPPLAQSYMLTISRSRL